MAQEFVVHDRSPIATLSAGPASLSLRLAHCCGSFVVHGGAARVVHGRAARGRG
jgi:hypothetical protein